MTEGPCLNMWDGCPHTADGDHLCGHLSEHEGRCRCAFCGATTAHKDPIFEDPEELERAQELLGD